MKEMIFARKAELEKRGVKGFTLMEMLIVVAIIAVLVAIAIPVFSSQLNNAKVQADAANIRGGYATVTATILTDATTPAAGTTYGLNTDGTITAAGGTGTFKTQGAPSAEENVGGSSFKWSANQTPTYTWDGSKVTITMA
jgi:type IV pilus assembly protein PilA